MQERKIRFLPRVINMEERKNVQHQDGRFGSPLFYCFSFSFTSLEQQNFVSGYEKLIIRGMGGCYVLGNHLLNSSVHSAIPGKVCLISCVAKTSLQLRQVEPANILFLQPLNICSGKEGSKSKLGSLHFFLVFPNKCLKFLL